MQKNLTLVKLLLAIFFIATLFLSYLLLSRTYSCGNFISKDFELIYPDANNQCSYIVLKKKNKQVLSWLSKKTESTPSGTSTKSKASSIDTASAVKFIMWYNEKHNPTLMNSSFIDMDRKEMLLYLIDVASVTKDDKDNICRIYLADRSDIPGIDSISTIVTAKTDKGEIFLTSADLSPLDWGSLCPPPYENCINSRNAYLLKSAIRGSKIIGFASRHIVDPIVDPTP
ncbi:MAG: hypothetical protein QM687_01115 [Ferruginibacter sp.]